MREDACLFGKSRSLVGVVTEPPETTQARRLPAFIILNSGIVHRVGLNRLHVKLARNLAAMGFAVMRFDFSGIGDSQVRTDNLPFFKSALDETREAMDFLVTTRGIARFILIGICSSAAVSLRIAATEPRVVGAVPINFRGYFQALNQDANAHLRNRVLLRHYWRIAFSSSFRGKNWLKAITGKVDYRNLIRAISAQARNLLSSRRGRAPTGVNPFVSDLRLLAERGARVLLIHAEGDEGLDYVKMFLGNTDQQSEASAMFKVEIVPGANHTFTLLWSQERLLKLVRDWAQEIISG
jgi:pimeloyl-ACP methyl ester carboxylesterase